MWGLFRFARTTGWWASSPTGISSCGGSARDAIPNAPKVREVMTPHITYCFEDQDIEEAAELMREQKIRRLAVLNRQKRLVGIVSLGDLAVDSGDEHLAWETLERVSEPVHASA